ncbi:hypothetical protein PQR71_28585 [Paraburkholderia fungorum]|uniref:hypothetical protein n=1 Tax=Paraburkholderia fungorum TaxID=134537 RepID=UPI0038B90605
MLPDRPEAREKFLCAFRVAKAAHATLMMLLPVVDSGYAVRRQARTQAEVDAERFAESPVGRMIAEIEE